MIVSAIFSVATPTYNYIYTSIVLMMMQLINNLKDTIIIKMAIGRENKNQQQNYVIIFSSPRR
jgi:hypothetical protein